MLAAQVRVCLAAAPIPAAVRQAVVGAWLLQGAKRTYAVRSSALSEDLPGASFAGQGETILNVYGRQALLDAVRTCWLSLYADRAVVYRLRDDAAHRAAEMAVVVQELVSPEVAGVLFTADPVTGSAERIVIEASYGLGSNLVNGRVSPDRIVLARPGLEMLWCETGSKAIEAVADGEKRIRQRPVDSARARATCLDRERASRLGILALAAERALGGPQDLEWAAVDGHIYLLQSRPITTLCAAAAAKAVVQDSASTNGKPAELPVNGGKPNAISHQTTWSNMNSWEILPDVVTPMSWSVVRLHLDHFFRPLLEMLGIDLDRHSLFGLIAGRAYANLDTFAEIVRSLPGLEQLDFSECLGGQHGERLTQLVHRPFCSDWRERLRRMARWPRFIQWAVAHAVDQRNAARPGRLPPPRRSTCRRGANRHV